MKQITCGAVAILGMLSLAGCYSYASKDINNSSYDEVQANPVFATMAVGDSDEVIFRLVNEANNGTLTSYTVTGVPAGIAVHQIPNYRPQFLNDTLNPTGDKTAQAYYIDGLVTGRYTFTVTPTSVNTGVSTTVTVLVQPKNLGPVLSAHTAALGDTITATAPAGTVFTQASAISFPSGTVAIISRAPDSTSFRFIAGPAITGPASITLVGQTNGNGVVIPRTFVSTDSLVSPAIALGNALSTTSTNFGVPVTITAPAGLVFSKTSAITFPTGTIVVASRAADSTSITFIPGPGVSGPATVTKVGIIKGQAVGTFTVATTNTLTTPALVSVPTTVSTTTPVLGTPMTVTLGGGFRFTKTSTITFGGNAVVILATSADSSTATVLPTIAETATGGTVTTGLVAFTNIVLSNANTLNLAAPGDKTVTTSTSVFDPNAGTIATASTINLAASGSSIFIAGSGALVTSTACGKAGSTDGCQWYKVVVTASTTIDIDDRWQGGSDEGLYILNSTGTSVVADADGAGQVPGNEPETKTVTLAPGTYFFGQVFFGSTSGYDPSVNTVAPTYYLFTIKTH
jgi:hypothetical protein